VSKALDTRADAESWLMARSVELDGHPELGAGITLGQLWGVYEQNRLPELALTTQKTYRQRIRHVLDRMGDRDISTITHGEIQLMFDDMKPSIAKRTCTALSAVLTYGVRHGLLETSPMYRAPFAFGETQRFAESDSEVWDDDPFAAIEDRRDIWNAETISRCMGMIRGLALEPVWLCCVGAGLRVEEAFALRKMDVRRVEIDGTKVTQLALHHALTTSDGRHRTKNRKSARIVSMLEPMGSRLWEIVQAVRDNSDALCVASTQNYGTRWRGYFAEPPTSKHLNGRTDIHR
jgi:hypothetical protein